MKRYAATIDLYVYAKDDEKALKKALKIVEKIKKFEDNYASLLELYETPFASLTAKKIYPK